MATDSKTDIIDLTDEVGDIPITDLTGSTPVIDLTVDAATLPIGRRLDLVDRS